MKLNYKDFDAQFRSLDDYIKVMEKQINDSLI